ncbi:hypothetical protein [Planococcus sp. ISL-110]|uniref:anti-sigma-I factor RsgI family protein n=1 Tax=Planococcus sp. ISL-110 TaxID=2819167 RepID=UPI001BEA2045|nr:hypothetical protein [Planococcus sp. ISL-110]MBT2570364.1 hypothetical protein [Planococcus sp. ISL-110]
MRIKSGICIELNHDRSIFLMKNGQFVKGAPAGDPSIGEEASFYPWVKKPAVRWQPVMAPAIAAIAAAVLFMSVLAFPAEEAFSYVQVQINPGIELGINDRYEVVSIRELNSDGYDLIHQLDDWENEPLFDVLNRVFELAVTDQTEQITITAVEEDDRELDESIKKFVLAVSAIAQNENMAIQMKEATKEQWRQSKDDHVPVGQMIEKAENLKIQKETEVQEPTQKVVTPPVSKEDNVIDEKEAPSESKQSTSNKETNKNKETNPSKEENESKEKNIKKEPNKNKPTEKNTSTSSAKEKKKGEPLPKTEQQPKKTEQNNKADESSTKADNPAPVKKKEKEKSVKPVPKEKPVDKKGTPAGSANSSEKKETHLAPLEDKKKEQSADHSGEKKQKEQKEIESSTDKGSKQEKKQKE